ncbi:hypothetical protein OJ996_22210 [Luteolibacter sp. GHJ8]|uniref:HEPN domain-containing protein n=1 Tax=Luteolibacter rhizosphaerae TaxID=2989719 RepID=A0ABT3G936_9BACT|nr:hypothetical protein [Luteolibacter rhizosphaerae]MCW1916320.1 hypothetical protein [Luteolibacter rhizosphaerae]
MNRRNTKSNSPLEQSIELAGRLAPVLGQEPRSSKPRFQLSRSFCEVAIEHTESARLLLMQGNVGSATGLLRSGFEAVLRAVWIHYRVAESSVAKLAERLTTEESARHSDNLPMIKEMLDDLEMRKGVPIRVLRSLRRFGLDVLKESNSAVHSGPLAIYRHRCGYPDEMRQRLLCSLNDLLLAIARVRNLLRGAGGKRSGLDLIAREFADCLPPLEMGA